MKKPEAHQIAREVAEDGQQQQIPVAHLAVRAFSELNKEDVQDLAEAAEEGDEEALQELRANHVEAIEAMIEALQDEDARQMIGLGIMLAQIQNGGNPAEYLRDTIQGDAADGMLDMV